MPRRTNEFQKLVYLVRANLAAGATVTESKMLRDRLTKRKREVDVCVEGTVGGHVVKVCIECRDHKRLADVTWVETMKAKHERLPTNALILASRSGFTKEAREVARVYGIETLALEEVENTDFPALLKATSSLWAKSVTMTARKVLVKVLATPTLAAEKVAAMPDNLLYAADGAEIGSVGDLVGVVLKSTHVRDYLLRNAKEEYIQFEFRGEPPRDRFGNPLFLKKLDPETLREIESIRIMGPCEFKISKFGLRRGLLGEVQIAWGTTNVHGRDVVVAATRNAEGLEKFSLSFAGIPPDEPDARRPNERLRETVAKHQQPSCSESSDLAEGQE